MKSVLRYRSSCSTSSMKVIQHQIQRFFYKRGPSVSTYKTTPTYIEEMYNAWLRDPTSVHRSWDAYFRSAPNLAMEETEAEMTPVVKLKKAKFEGPSPIDKSIDDHAAVHVLIRNYQTRGHSIAQLNPLETNVAAYPSKELHAGLNFLPHHWEREFRLPSSTLIGGKRNSLVLTEIIRRLDEIYCKKIGIEYMFLDSLEQQTWIQENFEKPGAMQQLPEEKRQVLARLTRAVGFEKFLAKNFSFDQSTSLIGCEMLIPALKKLVDVSSTMGVKSIIMGLPRRGRLNILANVCKKPLRNVFSLFNGELKSSYDDLGDNKYTFGTIVQRHNWTTNKEVRFAVISNPMHLEAYVPVVQGRTYAEQIVHNDQKGSEIMSILVHDDAALYGQGVTYETMQLSVMANYNTHGTIHVVINTQNNLNITPSTVNSSNQTNPSNPRGSQYCTNIGRAMDAPIFHVNASDPDAVIHVCKVAAEWRAQFHKDVIIELNCYLETEDKSDSGSTDTQAHKTCIEAYRGKLLLDNTVTMDEAKADVKKYKGMCQDALDSAKQIKPFDRTLWIDTQWPKLKNAGKNLPTGVNLEALIKIGNRFLAPPENDPSFVLSKALHRILFDRKALLDNRMADWALAEALAFGTLLKEGFHVRLSGQAINQGGYLQRHHLLYHQLIPGKTYNALQNIHDKQAPYVISQSTLTEHAVLGFEHGYSMANPNALVIWEAQHGDFTSTAQSIIDHFIATGEMKWGQRSGLVLLLPHSMDGKGPDQSSARLERFLQMCCDDPEHFPQDSENFMTCQLQNINWIVANCSTPANYFHILRRQVAFPFRKPLVLIVPKTLCCHNGIKSFFEDMCKHSKFQPLIIEKMPPGCCPSNFRKLIFCTGHIYYDLVKARAESNLEDEIFIVRIEQIAPFPYELVKAQVDRFEHAELVWVQEEHKNQGAWSYVQPRFQTAISDTRDINYVGRTCSGLPATMSKAQHQREHAALLDNAMAMSKYFCGTYW